MPLAMQGHVCAFTIYYNFLFSVQPLRVSLSLVMCLIMIWTWLAM